MTWDEAEAAEAAVGGGPPACPAAVLMRLLFPERWVDAPPLDPEMTGGYVHACCLVARVQTEAALRAAVLVRAGYGADDIIGAADGRPPDGFEWPADLAAAAGWAPEWADSPAVVGEAVPHAG